MILHDFVIDEDDELAVSIPVTTWATQTIWNRDPDGSLGIMLPLRALSARHQHASASAALRSVRTVLR